MNFNSQICTTKEQSERLLKLGIKAETADMTYFNDKICSAAYNEMECPYDNLVYPAWSLHRLMKIGNFVNIGFLNIDKMYECCITMLEGQIRGGIINKEYLKK